ncbi:MAG: hypothetical protein ACRD6X_20810 [Pyrinomonadaceae bacterium]
MKNLFHLAVLITIGLAASVGPVVCQTGNDTDVAESRWSKNGLERDERISLAEREKYNIRWIYISGNTYTRHREFRKKMVPEFNEGYIFVRSSLDKSVRKIAKMKVIYPITFDEVKVMLDEKEKFIDFTICVKQKQK